MTINKRAAATLTPALFLISAATDISRAHLTPDATAGFTFLRDQANAAAGDLHLRTERPHASDSRPRLLANLCYPRNLPPEEMEELINETGLLPPMLGETDPRYWRDVKVWTGDGLQGDPNRAQPARLTYSFPADGTTWGGLYGRPTGGNTLNAELTAGFGSLDLGREYIRQALAAYKRYGGIRYDEVADFGLPMSNSVTRSVWHGDIRIGGFNSPCSGCLAYNAFPSGDGIVDEGGGDMVINMNYMDDTHYLDPANNYRYLRNTISHEHGHGTGAIHSVPCNETKNMEPFISVAYDMLQVDDIRGTARSYGDRFAGNHSAATAVDLGLLAFSFFGNIYISSIHHSLSLNGTAGFGNTDEDWFKFTTYINTNTVITVSPSGGSYTAGQQSSSCSGTTAAINAGGAGNLFLYLYASNGTTILQSANLNFHGQSETLTLNNLAAGDYYIRVRDAGANAAADQYVQLYSLTVRVNDAKAPPYANAGINKRARANQPAHFIGNIHSHATDGFNFINRYDWDLDGDGSYEIINNPTPSITYVSNGVYNVGLRVRDLNNLFGYDTITCTVFGATTALTSIFPASGNRGTTVPVILTGANLKNLQIDHITISGTGVGIIGTPQPNPMGTQVTGLSFVIAANAPLGSRSFQIVNSDGSVQANNLFTVTAPPTGCPGDANNDNVVNFADVTSVLTFFGATYNPGIDGLGDANNDGTVNFADITSVLTNFGIPCP